ncbi:hypothetical protein [Williamsia herbipolensis]|uniref:hypothetical protein n=1 Tax=Williamsia herbipolensis TaxID=1603258 RepID=UPI000A4D81A1|nr:hypothetical protein [Williamsia herbipolensis]
MKIRTALVSAAVTVASVAALTTGAQASAAPAAAPTVNVAIAKQSVSLTAVNGSFRSSDKNLEVLDGQGRVARTLPLNLVLDNVSTPVKTSITGRTATLTPQIGRIEANTYFTDPPRTRKQRDDQALQTLGDNLGVATGVGALVGTIIGAGLGCVILIATGCLPGLVTGAGIGGTIGTISAGGPVLIGNINEYFKTIRSPFVPPKPAPKPAPAR